MKTIRRIAFLSALGACPNLATAGGIAVDEQTFGCIRDMTPVRGFFVGNLAGNIEDTLTIANAGTGTYPPGSVVQLVPSEVMVKPPATGNLSSWMSVPMAAG